MRPKSGIGGWPGLGLMLLVMTVMPGQGLAESDRTAREIAHLMGYIAASECLFIRNGKAYRADEARTHIQRKYDHLRTRIRTAEAFILRAASRSSLSGEPYRLQCGDKTVLCSDWLHAELRRYRQAK